MSHYEILTLAAMWCSTPVNSTKGAMGFKSGTDISIQQVNTCREKVLACESPSGLETATKRDIRIYNCVKEVDL